MATAHRFDLSATQRTLVLAATALIAFETVALSVLFSRGRVPELVLAAAAIDAVLISGGTLWWLARRAGGWRALGLTASRWRRIGVVTLALRRRPQGRSE